MAKKTNLHQTKTHWPSWKPERLKLIKKIIGSLLSNARAVNNKLLVALNAISAWQAKAMLQTEQLVKTLLNYATTYPNNDIVYRASDIVLCVHADAGYLNKTQSLMILA